MYIMATYGVIKGYKEPKEGYKEGLLAHKGIKGSTVGRSTGLGTRVRTYLWIIALDGQI